jgi:hypothetical protein
VGLEEIGYCGLHCGGCLLRQGVEADLSPELWKLKRQVEFHSHNEALAAIPYFQVMAGCPVCLETRENRLFMRCPRSCRQGGGNPSCAIRLCCLQKGLSGCWQCPGFRDCLSLAALAPAHGSAVARNLECLMEFGIEAFLGGVKHWCDPR